MGGNVGIIIKKENDEQIGMSRWTNVMPYFFTRFDLYSGNTQKWLDEFSSEWLLMKNDYENNKNTGQYKFNMTDIYFPWNALSPDEYGLIAVDIKNKKIYSSQDYCNIGSLAFYNIWKRRESNQENIELIKKYVDNGFIKEMKYYDADIKDFKIINIETLNLVDIIQLLKETSDEKVKQFSHPLFCDLNKEEIDAYTAYFVLDTDWKFTVYHDRTLGILKIRKEMSDNGFIFSSEDDIAWKNYLAERFDYSNESELLENKDYQEFKILYLDIFKEPYLRTQEKNNDKNKIRNN